MKVLEISATARTSFKQPTLHNGDVYYTFEYNEKWGVEGEQLENLPQIKQQLWQKVNQEVNTQITQTLEQYKNKG